MKGISTSLHRAEIKKPAMIHCVVKVGGKWLRYIESIHQSLGGSENDDVPPLALQGFIESALFVFVFYMFHYFNTFTPLRWI